MARILIAGGLVALLILWMVIVIRHFGWRILKLQHSTVALYAIGQILLEDPYS